MSKINVKIKIRAWRNQTPARRTIFQEVHKSIIYLPESLYYEAGERLPMKQLV
jgi:hypothetical protein